MEDVLPFYLEAGVSYERFMDSTPNELKPYAIAFDNRVKHRDQEMWMMGAYIFDATRAAVAQVLLGPKAHISYMSAPILESAQGTKVPQTVEEKKKVSDNLFAMLSTMQANFELTHRKED